MTVRSCRSISISVKRRRLGVSIDDINDTLQTAWGVELVNDFADRGRVKESLQPWRRNTGMLPDDINLGTCAASSGIDGAILGLRHLAPGDRLAAAGALQWLLSGGDRR
ncbi:hypothetical protein MJ575_21540 [Klebsiella pneumoniae]|nr:hypothetical protein MJ575_21540 [Klebsiella pneumoniae]